MALALCCPRTVTQGLSPAAQEREVYAVVLDGWKSVTLLGFMALLTSWKETAPTRQMVVFLVEGEERLPGVPRAIRRALGRFGTVTTLPSIEDSCIGALRSGHNWDHRADCAAMPSHGFR